jgi:hypothetical protein
MSNRSLKRQKMDMRIGLRSRPILRGVGRAADTPAPNDNFGCFEQMVFERAVRRELSGDVDFE